MHIQKKYIDRIKTPLCLSFSSKTGLGINIFDLDWDLLIVLDTCRVDALKKVAPEYEFLNADEIDSIISVGGSTLEWTAKTFSTEHIDKIRETALISNNPWPWQIIEERFDPVEYYNAEWAPISWNTVGPNTIGDHIPAWKYGERSLQNRRQASSSIVRDLTINAGRKKSHNRTIAHFIEPHKPYIAAAQERGSSELNESEEHPWNYLSTGGDSKQVWQNYLTELRSALDDIEILLSNFDAESVVITADHGEALGEWGIYGHTGGSFHPHVRRVPLIKTDATDEGTHDTNIDLKNRSLDVEDQLQSLGYL